MAKFCTNCGQEVQENADVCLSCGVRIQKQSVANNQGKTDISLIGLICSVVGILCCAWVAIPGLILSIMGYQKAQKGMNTSPNSKVMAIIGMVVSGLALALWIFNIVSMFS